MNAERALDRCEHILEAIEAIESYVRDKTFADYERERIIRDAVERNIEKISEASRHIPDDLKARFPDLPWPLIASIGNVLRHAYDKVDSLTIWATIEADLPPLKQAIVELVRVLQQETPD